MKPSFELYRDLCVEKNYLLFSDNTKPYNLNIVGWRNINARVDAFDDFLGLYWLEGKIWQHHLWPITTYPGWPSLLRPVNPAGAAILMPGQYLSTYRLGPYKGYRALKQVRPVRVYRDANLDSNFTMDEEATQSGFFGIHVHRAGLWNKLVGVSSAGCQVFQKKHDFEEFIWFCETAESFWGPTFTYTLVEYS